MQNNGTQTNGCTKKRLRPAVTNKLVALAMILIGLLSLWLDRDATLLVLTTIVGIPLFFSKKRWFY